MRLAAAKFLFISCVTSFSTDAILYPVHTESISNDALRQTLQVQKRRRSPSLSVSAPLSGILRRSRELFTAVLPFRSELMVTLTKERRDDVDDGDNFRILGRGCAGCFCTVVAGCGTVFLWLGRSAVNL